MPTNKKWGADYNGHYALEGGTMVGDTLLNDIESLPHWKGVQKRFSWRQFESNTTPGEYNFGPLITYLNQAAAKGKKVRVLLMYKAFGTNARAVPDYITKTPSEAGYDPVYTDTNGPWYGAYKWGGVGQAAALWIPAVADRFIAMLQAMAAAVDNHAALATVDMNETSMGSPTPALTLTQKQNFGTQMARILQNVIPSFAKTPVGWFVNFPVTGTMNILNYVPPALRTHGGVLAGPDIWFHDVSLENGVIEEYFDSRDIIPLAPSIQNANYQHYNHDEQSSKTFRFDIDLVKLFNRATETPDTFNTPNITGGTKQPLHANYTAWSAYPYPISDAPTGSPAATPLWTRVKAMFADLVKPGGRYPGSTHPGISLTIPSKFETTPPSEVLPVLTASLATDSGPSSSDLITNVGTVNSSALASGATRQYRKGSSGSWSNTQPAVTPGVNTYYVRQIKSGLAPSEPSAALTFTYDNTPPTIAMATIDDNVVLIAFESEIPLSNTTGYRPVIGDFTLTDTGGGTAPTRTGSFVNENGKNFRLDLGSNATAGNTYTLTYTPAAGNARLQDKAGNMVAGFTNLGLINITGTGSPTQTVNIGGIPGVSATGGYTNNRNWTLTGTVSASLGAADQVQIDRRIGSAGTWENIGYATVTGTSWSLVQNEEFADGEVAYRGKVRRGIGSKVGPTSSDFVINVLTATLPTAPTVVGGTFLPGNSVVITGTWAPVAGHTLSVSFRGTNYTSDNGLIVTGSTFSLTIAGVPPGIYTVGARVTDPAGNIATDEDGAVVNVLAVPSRGKLSLAMRRGVYNTLPGGGSGSGGGESASFRYVRAGATGGNGLSWATAWGSVGASSGITAGMTVWIAGGTYGATQPSWNGNAANRITLRAATVANHGGNTGWDNAYAIDSATPGVVNNPVIFDAGGSADPAITKALNLDGSNYVTVDGQLRGANLESGYGIVARNAYYAIHADNGSGSNGITLRYIEACVLPNPEVARREDGIQGKGNNLIVEYCYIHDNDSGTTHGDGIQWFGGNNIIIRYNVFKGNGQQIYMGDGDLNTIVNNAEIYYNLIYNRGGGHYNGIVLRGASSQANYNGPGLPAYFNIYNNTFDLETNVDDGFDTVLNPVADGPVIRFTNNAFRNTGVAAMGWRTTNAKNAFDNSGAGACFQIPSGGINAADLGFVASTPASALDFRPGASSVLRGQGNNVSLTVDIRGTAVPATPDIGCFQYVV